MGLSNNFFGVKRNIDIVFCIDGTGSMTPCIENVKSNARKFYSEFAKEMTNMGSDIEMMRIKIIVFRDFKCDGQDSLVESTFFELPAEEQEFSAYLDGIEAFGGCNEDANGLEALYRAMKSDFTAGVKDRQVIVLFSDTTAIPLGRRKGYRGYPRDMVDEDGFKKTWECISQESGMKLREGWKRLVLFAPKGTRYEELVSSFNRSVFESVNMNAGLRDINFEGIIKIIAASAGNA